MIEGARPTFRLSMRAGLTAIIAMCVTEKSRLLGTQKTQTYKNLISYSRLKEITTEYNQIR
ncbi:hypothetical protein LCGC14_2211810 [marine sediment metagenome]|uniref:Uncharacterized protein n=1 Tax=marine sediment metagenome TaxID=412755 RepID=A0A0F9FR42_9ZZZZ